MIKNKLPVVVPVIALAAAVVTGVVYAQTAGASEIKGTVQSISGASIVVDGKTVAIDAGTRIEGTLAQGAIVEVETVVREDGSLLAVEIEVENAEDDERDSETGADDTESDDIEDKNNDED